MSTNTRGLDPRWKARVRARSEERALRARKHGSFLAVRDHALIEVLLGAGPRAAAAGDIRVGDAHLASRPPKLIFKRKGGGTYDVVISSKLARFLGAYLDYRKQGGEKLDDATPLFPSSRRGPLGRQAVWRIWRAALVRAGVPEDERVGVHGARHLYATAYYADCRDLRRTQVQLGHRRSSTTERYTAVLDEDRAATAERLHIEEASDDDATE